MTNIIDHASELRKGADALAPNNKLIADKMRAAADFIDELADDAFDRMNEGLERNTLR